MTCPHCPARAIKHGRNRNGSQRWRCKSCGRTFSEERRPPLSRMRIPEEKAVLALSLLAEGCSIRSAARLTGLEKKTVLSLLLLAGGKCRRILDERIRDVPCNQVQLDEIWTDVYKKQRRLGRGDRPEWGDQYVFVAMDPRSKLVLSHRVGKRTAGTVSAFLGDLESRLAAPAQLSAGAFEPYAEAVEQVFGSEVDCSVLVKRYGSQRQEGRERYAPSRFLGIRKFAFRGEPDEGRICTSHVERNNLTVRMSVRRFARLTNAFSKRLKHLQAAVAFHFCWYNFCRVHTAIRCTPAMEAGLADHIWEVAEILRGA